MPEQTDGDAAIATWERQRREDREERRRQLEHEAELDGRIAEALQRSRVAADQFV